MAGVHTRGESAGTKGTERGGKVRQGRFERRAVPGGLVLGARDLEIIRACYEHQWLTRQQIQRIAAVPGVTRVNQRLRQLYDAGFLGRLRIGTVGAGLQPVYLAGEAAIPLLANATGRSPSEVREHLREDARASGVLLPHDLLVNEVRIGLTLGLRGDEGTVLEDWQNARECFDPYAAGRSLRPDGYFRFVHREALYSFFLEVDRGTVSLSRWKEKVGRYLEYRESGAYARRTGLERFRVLVTAPTGERLSHLAAATREVAGRNFWFAPTPALLAAGPSSPLWDPVDGGAPRPLIPAPESPI